MLDKYNRILITGGEGFIGTQLTELLRANGKEIYLFDIKSKRDVRMNLLVANVIRRFKPDLIFNLASTAGINKVEANPSQCIETNIFGVRNIIKHKGDIKLVHFSSSEVYGEHSDHSTEDTPTLVGSAGSPRWSYQASKVCADHYVINADKNALIIRPFNIFGKTQTDHGAIADFVQLCKKNENIRIFGDGSQVRSWCGVEEFLVGVIALLEKDCSGIYNVGNPNFPQTIEETAEEIITKFGSQNQIEYADKREVDVSYRVPSIDKLIRDTEWQPTQNFHDELLKVIEYQKTI